MKLWTFLILLLGLALSACNRNPAGTSSGANSEASHQHENAEEYYTCTMHPEVKSPKPGKCPICHMDLVKVSKKTSNGERRIKFYRNPMDPSIHSDKPAKDSMGMDYIPVYEDEAGGDEKGPKAVGRAGFQLTPEQDALTGGKPIQVEARVLKREIEAPGRVTSGGRVSFQIFEQDFSLLKIGQSFIASSPSVPGEKLSGKITGVASILDPMTRTARVEGNLTGPQANKLRPESTVTGVIEVETAKVVAIPEIAVMHTGTQDIAFITDGKGAYHPRPITLGIKAQGYYEVTEGLKPGDLISSGPNFLLDSEARVRANISP